MNNFKTPFLKKDPIKQNETNKYKRVINKAILEKANKEQIANKLRETFPEIKNNSVEVTFSPDGKQVNVYKNKSK